MEFLQIGKLAGAGAIFGGILFVLFKILNAFRKADKYKEAKKENEALINANKAFINSIKFQNETNKKYDKVQNKILNDPDSIDTNKLLNTYDMPESTGPNKV